MSVQCPVLIRERISGLRRARLKPPWRCLGSEGLAGAWSGWGGPPCVPVRFCTVPIIGCLDAGPGSCSCCQGRFQSRAGRQQWECNRIQPRYGWQGWGLLQTDKKPGQSQLCKGGTNPAPAALSLPRKGPAHQHRPGTSPAPPHPGARVAGRWCQGVPSSGKRRWWWDVVFAAETEGTGEQEPPGTFPCRGQRERGAALQCHQVGCKGDSSTLHTFLRKWLFSTPLPRRVPVSETCRAYCILESQKQGVRQGASVLGVWVQGWARRCVCAERGQGAGRPIYAEWRQGARVGGHYSGLCIIDNSRQR